MKSSNKCVCFPKVSWIKEIESNLEYLRYKSILDHKNNLAAVLPKMLSSKAFQYIKHNRNKQMKYEEKIAHLRIPIIKKRNSLIQSASSLVNHTSLLVQTSFLNNFRQKQMQGFYSVASKLVEANKNKMNSSNQSNV